MNVQKIDALPWWKKINAEDVCNFFHIGADVMDTYINIRDRKEDKKNGTGDIEK